MVGAYQGGEIFFAGDKSRFPGLCISMSIIIRLSMMILLSCLMISQVSCFFFILVLVTDCWLTGI
jgi:hypothetical protein